MNLSLSKVLPFSRERTGLSQGEAVADCLVKDNTSLIPWIFSPIMDDHSTPDLDGGRQAFIPSTPFARFLLMSRLQ